jgi:Lrp/AsnC family transcriptional regulator, leucine-responsive regulatory protein
MDQVDYKILSVLHENARIPISEISRLISMSQPAVTERIRKLEEKGVIKGYQTKLSSRKLGKQTTTFVLFKTSNCKGFIDFCESSIEIINLYRISGEYNYLMKVLSETTESLAKFLDTCNAYGFSMPLMVLSTEFEDKCFLETPED